MSAPDTGLRLRIYQGRENGLMIIGSAEELSRLGRQLLEASTVSPNPAAPDWPPVVAEPSSSGPFAGQDEFKLSFHRLIDVSLPKSLRLVRKGPHPTVTIVVLLFALVGLLATVRWLI